MNNKEKELLLYNSLKNLHLLEKTAKYDAVHDLLGLQAQFSNNPKISLMIRCSDFTNDKWDEGLVKIWSHRSTMYVINDDDLMIYLSANNRFNEFEDGEWGITKEEHEIWSNVLLKEIAKGNNTRDGLKQACINLGIESELLKKVFNGWGGLLKEMTNKGLITCCTGTGKQYKLNDQRGFLDVNVARKKLVEQYFKSFGPATIEDCLYFLDHGKKEMFIK